MNYMIEQCKKYLPRTSEAYIFLIQGFLVSQLHSFSQYDFSVTAVEFTNV